MTSIISTISKIYAKALLESSPKENDFVRLQKELNEVLEVINQSQDLQIVLNNSSISVSKKLEIVNEIFGGKTDNKILNLIKLLVEKQRFSEIEGVKAAYDELVETHLNKKTVEITSPIELNFENKTNILFKLEHKLNCEVLPIWKIDKNLIAGLTFKFDDCIIDTSVNAKLENLRKNIIR